MTSILKVSEIQDPTNGNSALTINSSGTITIPRDVTVSGVVAQTQPAIYAQGGTNGNQTVTNGSVFGATNSSLASFLTNGTNQSFIQGGMGYNTATGRFSVPIAGVYDIYAQFYLNENNTFRVGLYKNTQQVALGHSNFGPNTTSVSCIQNMTTSDTIEFRHESGSNRTIYMGVNHTFVHMHRIG